MVKILVIDADQDVRELIVFALRFAGYPTHAVSTLNECFLHVSQDKPDIILIDSHVPGRGEESASKVLKSSQDTRLTPIVMLSANRFENITNGNTRELGYVVQKSMPIDQLVDAISAIIKRLRL